MSYWNDLRVNNFYFYFLVVKPFGELKSGDETDFQHFPPTILSTEYCDTLQGSMEQLTKGLETGIVLIQFEVHFILILM